ncbi:NAD-dependent epimerase/dehydratase family protein [Flavobacterium sp.]|uniref:NAD-dependent epimerase/dehydratase family protein n=1 Tax=Flavobacterium sp. TaxID=239 RepID=UPI002631A8D7|nr:NAD-dependent epimerase/dehydratase family protein [Flavobacterium sp.]
MILVTGGTGLVGAHLLLQLTEGSMPVRALYRTEAGKAKTRNLFAHHGKEALFEKISWAQGDITDIPSLEEAFGGITHVYHCAALISYDPADEELLRKVNIEGTANIVNLALAYGCRKLCHVSSVAALGDPKEEETVITEETEWNPEVKHSDYGISKHGAEMEVWRGLQEGLETVMVNPALIFGYGFWKQGSGTIFKTIDEGHYFYTKGNCGVIAAEDVATVMVQLMQSSIAGEKYTLVAEHMPIKELFDTIANGMGKRRPPVNASRLMTSVAWRFDWLISKLLRRKRVITRFVARVSHNKTYYSTEKINSTLQLNFKEPKAYIKELAAQYAQAKNKV